MSNDNNRYKNGKIYTIRNINDYNLIYVGSTIQPLYKRFHDHKKDSVKKDKYPNQHITKSLESIMERRDRPGWTQCTLSFPLL